MTRHLTGPFAMTAPTLPRMTPLALVLLALGCGDKGNPGQTTVIVDGSPVAVKPTKPMGEVAPLRPGKGSTPAPST